MLRIISTIDHRLQNTRCSGYVITPTDVRIAVDHLKSGKVDGFEGLCSDHFINGKKVICVFIYNIHFIFKSLLYTRFIDFRYNDTHTQG